MQQRYYSKKQVACWLTSNQLQSWLIDNCDRASAEAILKGLPLLAEAYNPDSTSDWSVEIPLGKKSITLMVDRETWTFIAIVPWKRRYSFHKRCPFSMQCYLQGERIPGVPRLETMLRWRGLEAARIAKV